MIKLGLIAKNSVIILLNLFAGVFLLASYVIPVYKYEWTQEIELSKISGSNSVLVALIILVASIVCASIAFALKRRCKSSLIIYIVFISLIGYKFIQIIPLYKG